MWDIKLYKELSEIICFDKVLYTPAKLSDLDKLVEWRKFIQIWEDRIAVHQIKSYWPKKLNEIDSFILSQPKDIQDLIKERKKQMYERTGRKFKTIKEIQDFLDLKIKW